MWRQQLTTSKSPPALRHCCLMLYAWAWSCRPLVRCENKSEGVEAAGIRSVSNPALPAQCAPSSRLSQVSGLGALAPFIHALHSASAMLCSHFKTYCIWLFRPAAVRLLVQVMKRRGEEYKLFWRDDRPDFVRLAAKYDALIVPFAAVGADDAYNLFMVRHSLSQSLL